MYLVLVVLSALPLLFCFFGCKGNTPILPAKSNVLFSWFTQKCYLLRASSCRLRSVPLLYRRMLVLAYVGMLVQQIQFHPMRVALLLARCLGRMVAMMEQ